MVHGATYELLLLAGQVLNYEILLKRCNINVLEPYGEIKVEKNGCTGHVQKRLIPKLRAVKASFKRDKADAELKDKLKDKISKIREKNGLKKST